MTTRYQGDLDTICVPDVRFNPGDPSASTAYNPMLRDRGTSCKTIFDCTVPFALKEHFERAQFAEVDLDKFLAG
jgi:4-hydroxy-3-polyprenylbenzoate decarboxylase